MRIMRIRRESENHELIGDCVVFLSLQLSNALLLQTPPTPLRFPILLIRKPKSPNSRTNKRISLFPPHTERFSSDGGASGGLRPMYPSSDPFALRIEPMSAQSHESLSESVETSLADAKACEKVEGRHQESTHSFICRSRSSSIAFLKVASLSFQYFCSSRYALCAFFRTRSMYRSGGCSSDSFA